MPSKPSWPAYGDWSTGAPADEEAEPEVVVDADEAAAERELDAPPQAPMASARHSAAPSAASARDCVHPGAGDQRDRRLGGRRIAATVALVWAGRPRPAPPSRGVACDLHGRAVPHVPLGSMPPFSNAEPPLRSACSRTLRSSRVLFCPSPMRRQLYGQPPEPADARPAAAVSARCDDQVAIHGSSRAPVTDHAEQHMCAGRPPSATFLTVAWPPWQNGRVQPRHRLVT